MTIGLLALQPYFHKNEHAYTVITHNATNKVTATLENPNDTVTVRFNDTDINNGDSVTWEPGENSIELIVFESANNRTVTYEITVIKE